MFLLGYSICGYKYEKEIEHLQKENKELNNIIAGVEEDFINYKKRISEIFPDE
jgi:molecular chaperone GrpE (heat shock protein)